MLSATLVPASVVAGKPAAVDVSVGAAGIPTVGGTVAVSVGGETFTSALSGGSASVPLSTLTRAGSHPVAVRYLGDDPLVGPADRDLTLTVRKATPAMSVKLARHVVKPGARATARVRISAPGLPAPGGIVTVKAAGRSAKFRLEAGVATVKVPAIAKRGKVEVAITYGGSAALRRVTREVTLRVGT